METKFLRVASREELQSVISSSFEQPIVVFKHSNACSISSAAYRELLKLDREVSLIEVQTAREISSELASVTGIQHESPQVIILRNGNAVWDASHFDIRTTAVLDALAANG